jgi:hypothetical protein
VTDRPIEQLTHFQKYRRARVIVLKLVVETSKSQELALFAGTLQRLLHPLRLFEVDVHVEIAVDEQHRRLNCGRLPRRGSFD